MNLDRELLWRRWAEADQVFAEAMEQPAPEQEQFVDTVCGDDRELCDLVLALLHTERISAGEFEGPDAAATREFVEDLANELAPERQVGRYTLVREIGRGGMGSVYLAEFEGDGFLQRVAVKLLRRGVDTEDVLTRFATERQILATLSHPNIAQLHDGGATEEGLPYLVMELVDGLPIDDYCDSHGLEVEQRLALVTDVCRAVQYAHQNLVIHRDLKPANVLVTGESVVKLLDFGIAKIIEEDPEANSHTRVQPRTAAYASPEQLADRPVSTTSDIYSLGVLLHKILTGSLPADVPNASTGIAADLEKIVRKATAEDPSDRYSTAAALAEDLGRFLSGEPVTARELTAGYRFRKFIARHRIGFFASVASTAALAAVLVLALWQAERASTQARRAERVASLLKGLFVDADPYAPMSGEVTVLELLDRGVERVETELIDDPEIQSELLEVLGRAYVGLGHRDQGIPLLRQMLAERRSRLGNRHPLTAEAMRNLGYALLVSGETDKAAPIIEEAHSFAEGQFGTEAPETAMQLFNVGMLRAAQGRRQDQEAIFRQLIDHYRKNGGDPSTTLALALGQLSVALDHQGENEESLETQRQALAMADQMFGPAHPYTSALRSNMGLRLFTAGALEEAESHLREAVTALEGRSGVHVEELVAPHSNLGLVLLAQGDFVGAEGHIRQAAEISRSSNPPDNFTRIGSEINLATVDRELGRLEAAEKIYRDALGRFERILGPEHQATARVHCLLGMTLWQAGELTAAERELETALAVQNREGVTPISLDETLLALGRLRLDQGRLDEAEPVLKEALGLREHSVRRGDWRLAEIELEIVASTAVRGRHSAELAEASYQSLKESLPADNYRLVRAQRAIPFR